ncbi:hypothetical protein Ct61P_08807 [Colletotrichum tofieldiae]|nr:hypothetical protein Ct61P_08807 [Colletotrichum tofieldiae]
MLGDELGWVEEQERVVFQLRLAAAGEGWSASFKAEDEDGNVESTRTEAAAQYTAAWDQIDCGWACMLRAIGGFPCEAAAAVPMEVACHTSLSGEDFGLASLEF